MADLLHYAGRYDRRVRASLDRIWENVFDWEHLAHLHDTSFGRCELEEEGPWGWRVRLSLAGAADWQRIELRADRPAGRYRSTTLAGTGAGSEIRVALSERSAHEVDVAVEFHLPEDDPARLTALGAGYAAAYARLWDEDEAMMRARDAALARPPAAADAPPLRLGGEGEVRARLPVLFDWAGSPWRLVAVDGALRAHSTVCPHWLGPLGEADVVDGAVRCPWHGWRFDVASGRCLTRPGARLRPPPSVTVADDAVWVGAPA